MAGVSQDVLRGALAALATSLALGAPASAVARAEQRHAVGRRPAAAESYERWVQPPAPWPLERRVARAVRAWASGRRLQLVDDARLALAARGSLGEAPRSRGDRFDLSAARARAHRLGWTDGELAGVAMRLPEGVDVERAVAAELAARLGAVQPNRLGVAARLDGTERVVVMLFSRRLLRLWPVPAQVGRGERLRVAGSLVLAPHERLRSLDIAVGLPSGRVERRAVRVSGGAFETAVDAGPRAGVLGVQLLVDRGRGPEIAAQMPVGVDRPPVDPPTGVREAAAAEDAGSPADLARRLAALVLGAREAAKVTLPATSGLLDEVAAAHAADMRDGRFFAHVSPRSGDLSVRLAARRVRVSRALENLARARDPEAALEQWLASPAHRANLLDADVDALGVGVALLPGGDLLAVLVLARLADAGDPPELASRALARLNADRLHRGLVPLAWDAELARAAAAHSAELAAGRPDDGLVDRVLHELDLGAAAADTFAGATIEAVTRGRNLVGTFDRAGVGVTRGADGTLFVTVLYGSG